MTEKDTRSTDESRRSFIRRGALASGGLAVGLGSVGQVTAQGGAGTTETSAGEGGDARSALMYNHAYHPGAQFRVVSPPIPERPDLEDRPEGMSLEGYTTRLVEYVNTSEEVQLLVPPDVDVERGSVYELSRLFSAFQATPAQGLVSIEFEPVSEGDALFDDDGNPGWEPGQDFDVVEGGGQALITGYRFYPGALFRITSGVVEWVPREKIQRSGASGNYNTRLAEYLGTNMSFVLYPAQEAQVEPGAVYVMHQESEPADAGGRLRLVSFSRVDESDLNQDLLGG